MKLTYADALLHLPVDAMLQSYLTQQGMVFAPDVSGVVKARHFGNVAEMRGY